MKPADDIKTTALSEVNAIKIALENGYILSTGERTMISVLSEMLTRGFIRQEEDYERNANSK